MKKQRYNVSEVAELLIEEMDNFKTSANELKKLTEELKSTSLQVDPQSMDQLKSMIDHQKEMEQQAEDKRKAFLDDLRAFDNKKRSRLPNGVIYALVVLFVAVVTFSVYFSKKMEEMSLLKAKIEFLQQKTE